MREAGGFTGAKNISPQWSADGRSLFFLSDRQGITNIYRASTDGGNVTQITNLLTGVSGITDKSPALSVAQNRLVFSAYENDGYDLRARHRRADRRRPDREPAEERSGAAADNG